jgi:hypothetical protein
MSANTPVKNSNPRNDQTSFIDLGMEKFYTAFTLSG